MKYGSSQIFLNQGKYVVEILKRFGMLDCKSMNNLMVTNLKLLNDDSLDTIDYIIPTDYWLFDVSNKYSTKYMFWCKHTELVYGGALTCSLSCSKTYDEVP